MGCRETRLGRGTGRGKALTARIVAELVEARKTAGVSQRSIANLLGWSQSDLSRIERLVQPGSISLIDLSQCAAVLGLELSVGLHPAGEPIRDKGHQVLIRRFLQTVGTGWRVEREVPLPNLHDPRAWDVVLRIVDCIVGVEAETRIRDVQALVRRMRQRQRDGGTGVIVLVLAETAHNRRVLPELLEALGPEFATSPRVVLRALREGRAIPGSGVILL
jgi:transcriptional regulator with XRE-family HTH domain